MPTEPCGSGSGIVDTTRRDAGVREPSDHPSRQNHPCAAALRDNFSGLNDDLSQTIVGIPPEIEYRSKDACRHVTGAHGEWPVSVRNDLEMRFADKRYLARAMVRAFRDRQLRAGSECDTTSVHQFDHRFLASPCDVRVLRIVRPENARGAICPRNDGYQKEDKRGHGGPAYVGRPLDRRHFVV